MLLLKSTFILRNCKAQILDFFLKFELGHFQNKWLSTFFSGQSFSKLSSHKISQIWGHVKYQKEITLIVNGSELQMYN